MSSITGALLEFIDDLIMLAGRIVSIVLLTLWVPVSWLLFCQCMEATLNPEVGRSMGAAFGYAGGTMALGFLTLAGAWWWFKRAIYLLVAIFLSLEEWITGRDRAAEWLER
ncbi:hypothetical protein K8I61_14350 [bacterium]|nr:hypothetical protein [bacterium]